MISYPPNSQDQAARARTSMETGLIEATQSEFTRFLDSRGSIGSMTSAWTEVVDKMVKEMSGYLGVNHLDLPTDMRTAYLAGLRERLMRYPMPDIVHSRLTEASSKAQHLGWEHPEVQEHMSDSGDRAVFSRIVRTEVTSAFNANTLQRLAEEGWTRKRWVARHDARTSHMEASGQSTDLASPFTVGGETLMFPGDPQGSPAQTYNCRCVLVGEEMAGPSFGRIPTRAEVQALLKSGKGDRIADVAAAWLDAAGFNELPRVLDARDFAATPGKRLTSTRLVERYPGKWVAETFEDDTFYRGWPSRDDVSTVEVWDNVSGASPGEFKVGRGIYSNGTHIGGEWLGKSFASRRLEWGVLPDVGVIDEKAAVVRVKVDPRARIAKWDDVPKNLKGFKNRNRPDNVLEWAVTNGYDGVDLSGTGDSKAGIVIYNRSMLIFERPVIK